MIQENQQYRKIGNGLVFYLTNEIDHHTANQFTALSDDLIDREQVRYLIFDFTGVNFMDSSGIGMLMGRYKKIMFSGGRVAVTNVGSVVDRIFLLSGVYQIIEKFGTTEEALEQFQKEKSMEG